MAPRELLRKTPWPVLSVVLAAAVAIVYFLLPHGPERPNVLWITIDSLRYDHLGCYGYGPAHTPNIDAIAGQGAAFSQAIAQASATRYSVPSMVTGRYPLRIQSRSFAYRPPEDVPTVAELLGGTNYRSLVITNEPPVYFSARGFDRVEKSAKSTQERTDACLQAIREPGDGPFFIWLYYWDPHIPYLPPARFEKLLEPTPLEQPDPPPQKPPVRSQRRRPIRDQNGLLMSDLVVMGRINFQRDVVPTPLDRQHLMNLYDAEIALVDEEIGKVVSQLKKLGLWDNTLVLITADHGEAFGEHQRYYHGLNLYDEVVRVPLIVKPPDALPAGMKLEAAVRNVDIMPTILQYCQAPIPRDLDGTSLRSFIEGQDMEGLPAYMEAYYQERGLTEHLLVGFRTQEHKLIYDMIQGRSQLFDLRADPGEQQNLLEMSPQEKKELSVEHLEKDIRAAFLAHLGLEDLKDLAGRKLSEEMDEETEERLRSLGYIE